MTATDEYLALRELNNQFEKLTEYFVIVGGDVRVYGPYTRVELLDKLKAEDYTGKSYWGTNEFYGPLVKQSAFSRDCDLTDTNRILIIKGDIIVPRPKTVVMDYDL